MVVVKPVGPHQWTTCFGSVQASHTRSRGALTTRLMTISRSAVAVSGLIFLSAILLLLFLNFTQVILETVEALFPELTVIFDPLRDVFERLGLQAARAPLRVAAAGNESGALQHLQVLGDRGQAHLERL